MHYELAQTGLTVWTYVVIGLVVLLVGAALFILARAVGRKNRL